MSPAAMERFAVIVPAYNASATIGDCLQAILSSATKPSEVIVYHDGLTENLSRIALAPACASHFKPWQRCWSGARPKHRRPRIDLRNSDFCRRRCHCCERRFPSALGRDGKRQANLGSLWIVRPGPAGDDADRALRKHATPLGPSKRPTRGRHILGGPRGGAAGRLLDRRRI